MCEIEDQTKFYNSKAEKTGWRDFIRLDFISLTAFTMAEILISLTIIGVIAAITLPSLRANINEKTWATQRKALHARLNQAISMMPSLNGYGEYAGTWNNNVVTVEKDTAAQMFLTNGLSKVMQINNICIPNGATRNERLAAFTKCGINSKLKTTKGNTINFPTKLSEMNNTLIDTYSTAGSTYLPPQKEIDTQAIAFETKNGESIAVFYNPICASKEVSFLYGVNTYYVTPYVCANFVYDLNGRRGPNKFGKDIGFITALYPTDSEVVAPEILFVDENTDMTWEQAKNTCSTKDSGRLANSDELAAMFYNKQFLGINKSRYFWSNLTKSDYIYCQHFGIGVRLFVGKSTTQRTVCIKR